MPIYAYRCGACGHSRDVLQKLSDALLTVCPVCGAEAFSKQVTAAGFQLKGSGWYVTDFRDNGAVKKAAGDAPEKADKVDAAPAGGATDQPAATTEPGGASSAPAPAPAAPPAASAPASQS